MNANTLKLDLAKGPSHALGSTFGGIVIRQGDKNGTDITAELYDHGTRLATEGLQAYIVIPLPDGEHYYRKKGTYTPGLATVTIDETEAASVPGTTDNAYFELRSGSTIIASTQSFRVRVLRNGLDGMEPGETYDTAIQEAIDALDEAVADLPDTVEEILEQHHEWTTTVQDNSVTDAKLIQSGGILSRNQRLMYRLANLLTHRTDEGTLAAISDAAQTPMAGLTVYGQSTQDGTPTPEAPVPIVSVEGNLAVTPYTRFSYASSRGVEYTQNDDGSISAVGTATGALAYLSLCSSTDNTFGLEGGETYTLVVSSKNVTLLGLDGTGLTVKVATVTIPESGTWTIGVGVLRDLTVDETFRFSLFKGQHTRLAAVPYGFMGLWAQGLNWLDPHIARGSTQKGITVSTSDADGWITISGTSNATSAGVLTMWGTNDARILPPGRYTLLVETEGTPFSTGGVRLQVYGTKESGSSTYAIDAGVYQMDYTENGIDRISVHIASTSSGTTVDGRFRLTLMSGTTAPTAYIPYTATVTPIPLDGHELRSLPDGTRDELTVDAEGHAVLVQRVGVITLTGTSPYNINSFGERGINTIGLAVTGKSYTTNTNLRCDHYTAGNGDNGAYITSNGNYIGLYPPDGVTDAGSFNTWLASNPVTVIYPLATPVTHDLGTIDPVPLVGPDLTAQTVPVAPFVLDAERDLNVTLARLEAAIAALA